MEKFELKLIRNYHSTLLKSVKTLGGIKKEMTKDDFMDIKWKCRVARLLVEIEANIQNIVNKIRELRKEYNCVEF